MNAAPADEWLMGGRGGRQRMIPDPHTGELTPYQRVSSFAKTLDDKEGLMAWKAWVTLKGAQADPGLAQQAVHSPNTPKGLIDRLAELGGGGDKAKRGSDRHAILAMRLTGQIKPGSLPEDAQQELADIMALIESHGAPIAVEAATVCDRWKVCGSVDLVLRDVEGRVIVCDFKTGSRIDALSWSIQLAAHARGQYWSFADNTRGDWVAYDRPRIAVIHAPQDGAAPRFIELDLDIAMQWADLAAEVRDARKQANRTRGN